MKDDREYIPGSTFRRSRKGLNPVNWERRNRRTAEDLVYGSIHKAIGEHFGCCLSDDPEGVLCGGVYPDGKFIKGHHLKTVATGGQDRNNEIPVCLVHHTLCHAAGDISAQCERFRRDLKSLACEITKKADLILAENEEET